jgi:hypothetical protein
MTPTKFKIIAAFLLAWCFFNNFQCEKKEEICSTECGQNSFCFEGKCMCVSGYGGAKCDSLSINQYIGHFVGTEIGGLRAQIPIDAQITAQQDWQTRGIVTELNGKKYSIDPAHNNKFNMAQHIYTLDSLYETKGKGSISQNLDTLTYTIYYIQKNTMRIDTAQGKLVRVR